MSERTRYLDRMFGDREGFVAVASKRGESSWDERTFSWPSQRADLLSWARETADHSNVFICPSMRASASRAKADMAGNECGWLWADVDWAKITSPRARRSVKDRIDQLGTYVVASGSGANVHVYVRLRGVVGADEHLRLNTGLRDYLYADAKQADNSLLRLPGTINRKPEHGAEGSPVVEQGGHGKGFSVRQLMTLATFKRVERRAAADASDVWEKVDVKGLLKGKARLMMRMDVEEAEGRYGSRHGAIWAVTGELLKLGLTPDQIHTIMDGFGPGVDKAETERGFNLHRDVARRIAQQPQIVVDAERALKRGDDTDGIFEELTDDDMTALERQYPNDPNLRKELDRRRVRRDADAIEAEAAFVRPGDDSSFCLTDALMTPPTPVPYIIDGLLGVKHNVVLTAQYKTGKTTFLMGSFVKALADGTPFLGERTTPQNGCVVGHWNLEMTDAELLDDYIRPALIENTGNVHWWGGQGRKLNLLTDQGRAWAVAWLRDRAVRVWTVDSWSRLAHMCGINENDGTEVLRVLATIDEIKREAGVDVCLLIAHTGRGADAQDRPKGAVELDSWTDARWLLTKNNDTEMRYLKVDGRGVRLAPTMLNYNSETLAYTLTDMDPDAAEAAGQVQTIVSIVTDNPGINKTELAERVKQACRLKSSGAANSAINEVVDLGWITVREEATGKGGHLTKRHYPSAEMSGNGVRKRASARSIDLSKAREPRNVRRR